jgi:hypothetical protein
VAESHGDHGDVTVRATGYGGCRIYSCILYPVAPDLSAAQMARLPTFLAACIRVAMTMGLEFLCIYYDDVMMMWCAL